MGEQRGSNACGDWDTRVSCRDKRKDRFKVIDGERTQVKKEEKKKEVNGTKIS